MISDFDEAHLQSLVSSLGKKQRFPEQSGMQYVKDPQSRGRSLFFFFLHLTAVHSRDASRPFAVSAPRQYKGAAHYDVAARMGRRRK
jgi:hypothetical protein